MPKKRTESGPSIEELFLKLERRITEFEDKIEKGNKDFEEKLECLAHKLENSQSFFDETTNKKNKESEEKLQSLFEKVYSIDAILQEEIEENEEKFQVQEKNIQQGNKKVKDVDEKLQSMVEKVYSMDGSYHQENEEMRQEVVSMKEMLISFKDKIELSSTMIENIQEKMYDYENTKKNNLIFYGIPTHRGETPSKLLVNIQDLIKNNLTIARDIGIESVNRVLNGPEVMGCRPVLVTFSNFKDKTEVLQKSKFVQKCSSVSVTEDISKKTREARQELRRFMVNIKRHSPEKKAFMEYDKLYVNGRVFVYSQEEGKVVRHQRSLTDMSNGRQSPSRSPCRSPSIYRSSSSFSMSSPDLIGNLELEEKLKELEMMIKEQKSVIHQQKNVITDQKETIDHLEISANQKNRNDDNLEDID